MVKSHRSILDSDQYKFTMQKAVMQLFPNEKVKYTFINRRGAIFPEGFGERLRELVNEFSGITMLPEEKENINAFLASKGITYFDPAYLEFLKSYKYDPTEVTINHTSTDLSITIEGYWFRTILWEVPLMATISELYFEMTGKIVDFTEDLSKHNQDKFIALHKVGAKFVEFGTRRRYSYDNHKKVLEDFLVAMSKDSSLYNCFLGTSNLHFAMMFDLKPMGTMAHEWIQFHAAKYGPILGNKLALENWISVFKGDLGIALPDTLTTNVFLRTFDKVLARIFDGTRQDSDSPFDYVDKMHPHYTSLGINPQTKSVMFSDNLKSVDAVRAVIEYSKGKMNPLEGLGTWITNDVGVAPLDIVIKLTGITTNGKMIYAVKLSDSKSKHTGDPETIKLHKTILGI